MAGGWCFPQEAAGNLEQLAGPATEVARLKLVRATWTNPGGMTFLERECREPNILKRKNGLNSHNMVYAIASQNQHWLILPHLRLIQNSVRI
jgi:hypothetical protein